MCLDCHHSAQWDKELHKTSCYISVQQSALALLFKAPFKAFSCSFISDELHQTIICHRFKTTIQNQNLYTRDLTYQRGSALKRQLKITKKHFLLKVYSDAPGLRYSGRIAQAGMYCSRHPNSAVFLPSCILEMSDFILRQQHSVYAKHPAMATKVTSGTW